MIRIDFPGFSGRESLERIEWDEWFQQFDENELAFLHRDMRHSDGQLDRFNKLVRRNAGRTTSVARVLARMTGGEVPVMRRLNWRGTLGRHRPRRVRHRRSRFRNLAGATDQDTLGVEADPA